MNRIPGQPSPWLDRWPYDPVIGPPVVHPLAFDLLGDIETPEYQKLGNETIGAPYLLRQYGIDFPTVAVDPEFLADAYVRTFPASSPERLRIFDELRCVDVDPAALAVTGTAIELVRTHVLKYGAGVVERIATIFDNVVALDANGDPLFFFGSLTGERPCIFPLQHPDPAAGTLSVEFRLLVTEVPDNSRGPLAGFPPYQGPVPPSAVPADSNLRPPWRDLRQGYTTLWSNLLQYVTGESALVRLWVIFSAQPDRWRLRVGGRLSGYWNQAGPMGRALDNATRRYL